MSAQEHDDVTRLWTRWALPLRVGSGGCAAKLCRTHLISFVVLTSALGWAQDLAPRAYIITPIHSNAVTLAYSFSTGNIIFDGSTPITDSTAKVNVPIFSLFHTLSFFGRSANFTASLPYGVGNFRGTVVGAETKVYRSGSLDSSYRFSVNLKGGRAMDLKDFVKWRQKTLVGVSIRMVAPTGQYDPIRLINYGANRWAFKPEVGVSQRWGHWLLDTYGGMWFYTTNHDFFSLNGVRNVKTQGPIFAFEGHLSYDVRARLWASLDGNFWVGGRTSLNGVENSATLQRNSRIGATLSIPLSQHQALKFSYSRGAVVRYGGNFDTVSMAWQYSWRGRPN
jgi:outer membrane putative beta-barrel porin/alpha-amylase